MKRHKHLIDRITDPENLRNAYGKTMRGKRATFGYLEFKEYAELNLGDLRDELADRFVHDTLGHRRWARYMDDIVVLGDDLPRLRDDFLRLADFSLERMGLRISKWSCHPVSRGVNFLGYRIWPTHKLLRKDSVIRAKRKISAFVLHQDAAGLQKFVASWAGHAQWADTHNLFRWMERRYAISFDQHPS